MASRRGVTGSHAALLETAGPLCTSGPKRGYAQPRSVRLIEVVGAAFSLARLMLIRRGMSLNSEHRWVRALLWLVIVLVPGGLLLFALLAADAMHRRLKDGPVAAESDASESGAGKRLASADQRA
jgi:hypothetical protein